MVCKRKEGSMKENKSDVTDAVQHRIAVVVAVCAILSGCGRNESAEFEITPPREWDEGISRCLKTAKGLLSDCKPHLFGTRQSRGLSIGRLCDILDDGLPTPCRCRRGWLNRT